VYKAMDGGTHHMCNSSAQEGCKFEVSMGFIRRTGLKKEKMYKINILCARYSVTNTKT
jgi:hypothetical protein